VQSTATNQAQAEPSQEVNDVGRRFPLGPGVDDPHLLINVPPECGAREYEGVRSAKGQFCVVRWTIINPGGVLQQLDDPVITLTDDRDSVHDRMPADLPASIVPGGRIDGVLVFDVPPQRTPAKLSITGLEGGKQIEVAL
jgi:hypothetical protein